MQGFSQLEGSCWGSCWESPTTTRPGNRIAVQGFSQLAGSCWGGCWESQSAARAGNDFHKWMSVAGVIVGVANCSLGGKPHRRVKIPTTLPRAGVEPPLYSICSNPTVCAECTERQSRRCVRSTEIHWGTRGPMARQNTCNVLCAWNACKTRTTLCKTR